MYGLTPGLLGGSRRVPVGAENRLNHVLLHEHFSIEDTYTFQKAWQTSKIVPR